MCICACVGLSLLPFPSAFVFIMSVASSGELQRRRNEWVELLAELTAAGVPVEAHPRTPPRCCASYSLKGLPPERNLINVCPLVRKFLIPCQVTGERHSCIIHWGDDPERAWREAKHWARW